MLAGVLLSYHYYKPIPEPLAMPVICGPSEVTPGGNKAILTLTNGRSLALEGTTYGELAREGFTQILYSGEGTIVYRTGKTTPGCKDYNVITIPPGGQYSVVLPDGSKIWLNNASRLRYPVSFNGRERRVELSGEAYFKIARNAGRPFYVVVGKHSSSSQTVEMEALGTEFDVKAYPDEGTCKATLFGGNLKLRTGRKALVLQPGQQAEVTPDENLYLKTDQDAEQAAAWKNGLFSFQGASIQEIMRQVARWYNVDVVYKDNIGQRFVGKIPRGVDITTLLSMLEATGWVHFRLKGRTVTVME